MKLSDFFSDVAGTLPARRGNLYKQYYKRQDKDGKVRRCGPYYVWTRCVDGKMVSERVPKEEVPRVREEIDRGKVLDSLLRQLWTLAENMARDAGDLKKKKSSRSIRRPRLSLQRR